MAVLRPRELPAHDVTGGVLSHVHTRGHAGRRRGPDRAIRASGGMYHVMGAERSFCMGDYSRSDWCTSQVRNSTEFTLDLSSVPPPERCHRARGRWPSTTVANTTLARTRRLLVARFGPGCVVCPEPWATKVGHNHITGQVREYLLRLLQCCARRMPTPDRLPVHQVPLRPTGTPPGAHVPAPRSPGSQTRRGCPTCLPRHRHEPGVRPRARRGCSRGPAA